MYYDLVAIEALYGRRAYNTGNNTYTFNDGIKYWQAIQDTGGIDIIVYNGAENATINLNEGTFSALSEAIQFWKASGGYTSAKNTVTIGPGVIIENALGGNGNDTLTGNSVNNGLDGGNGNDTLIGAGGNDVLVGGVGADTMFGGVGNDLYYVDNAGDIVNETGGNGVDMVVSTISFSLANTARVIGAVEKLVLGGGAAISGTGNALDNAIAGNAAANTLNGGAGNDVLDGLAGADTMFGGAGNDVYCVDNAGDIVNETGGNGTDTVVSTINFSLANTARVIGAVENLTLGGAAAISGAGNSLANIIIGNAAANVINGGAGNDRLYGGLGNDTLYGGAANDVYVFNTAPSVSNRDTIADFANTTGNDDTIWLASAIFTKLGAGAAHALSSAFFYQGAAAQDADDYIIYNQMTGALFYDSNGSAAGGAIQIAALVNKPVLTVSDFVVV
jgi:Ca2+-binding RTX toxin-like protein